MLRGDWNRGGEGRQEDAVELNCALPTGSSSRFSHKDDKLRYFGLVRQPSGSLSFQAERPAEPACGMKVLISFGDFQI